MSKFCGQCGAQLNDNATFCTNCGASITPQQTAAQQTSAPVSGFQQAAQNINMNTIKDAVSMENIKNLKSKPNKLTIAILGILLALIIILVIILCAIFGGGSYKTPIDNLVKVYNKGDGDALEDLMPPYYDDMSEALSGLADVDFDEKAEEIRDEFEDEFGEDAKMSYEIIDKEKLDDDELDDYNAMSSLTSLLSDKKASKYEVTKAYQLTVKFTVEGDDDDSSEKMDIVVGKMDGEWCLLDGGDLDIM